MRVVELGHVVLYVRDLERSVVFYRDVLGWTPVVDGRMTEPPLPIAAFSGDSGRTHHELLLIDVGPESAPIPEGRRVGLYHFGVKIGDHDDDLRDALARLDRHDIPLIGATDHGMTHSLYVYDPDGNEVELYVDVPGVDWGDPTLWTDLRPRVLQL
ncbi:MAG: VOC family protein [Acidimicrobiaceae bacterium]|nr:VOC family protein [Acidimicrobiaceae bacterium]